LPGFRVNDTQHGRVKGHAFGAAFVGVGFAVDGPVVDPFATNRRAGFAEVNAHLMSSTCLKPAFDQGEVTERFDDVHMGHGSLALARLNGAASPSIASVVDKMGFDASVFRLTSDKGQVTAFDGVRSKLFAQMGLGFRRTSEDH
jgi:hypothetical protein